MKYPSLPQDVEAVFNTYPEPFKNKLLYLRRLVFEVAEAEKISALKETLKWNEPSYLAPKGSTLRLAWHAKQPDVFGLYVQCTSKLIPTFKVIYKDVFNFEGNRAIQFTLHENLPEVALKDCIRCALQYHKIKHLPYLGL
ncbi:DUF1801 domain-containing protein [Formosa sp. A9]|uniref:DUF1801 domain-containing protein n=1 Tax=Formosa sp. A9 TaxID=3442641 RepID=UPI003EBB2A46